MARTATKSVDENMVAVDNTAATVSKTENEKENEMRKSVKTVRKTVKPIDDDEEIEVVSLIPNVSYKDKKTGDMYEWDEVGHVEYMTFETIKNMHRNFRSYFLNMWLRPNDERVIKKLGIERTFEKYDFIMNEKNYNEKNIDKLCSEISNAPNGLKFSIINKIGIMVENGSINNIKVIRKIEKLFNVDLISTLK